MPGPDYTGQDNYSTYFPYFESVAMPNHQFPKYVPFWNILLSGDFGARRPTPFVCGAFVRDVRRKYAAHLTHARYKFATPVPQIEEPR